MERTTIRAPSSLLERFDEVTEGSRSEEVRKIMQRTVAEKDGRIESEQLAKAYDVMLEHANRYENGARRVKASEVTPIIANQANVEGGKDAVHSRIFRPLRERGFIKPRAGFIWIKPRGVDPVNWGGEDG